MLKAIVRVTLDIEVPTGCVPSSTFDQVAKIAEEEARHMLTSGNEHALKEIPYRIRGLEVKEVRVIK